MPFNLPTLLICQWTVPAALPPSCKLCRENVTSLQTKHVLVSTGRQGLEGRVKGSLCEVAGALTPVAASQARHTYCLRPPLVTHTVSKVSLSARRLSQ